MNKKVIVITGPTGSGKSALSIALAKKLKTEIISADSRQIYKGIPIATAVPSFEERENIPHYLIEKLNLDDYYSASLFEEDALRLITEIINKTGTAIICGGSMLYVDALCNGIDDLPTVPDSIRKGLMEEWRINGDLWLKNKLKEIDPETWQRVDNNNMKRIFHAVEITMAAGEKYSNLLGKPKKKRPFETLKICLDGSRDILFDKINKRVIDMFKAGLEEEAKSVYHLRHLNSLNTVGLKEMFAWFEGGFKTKDETLARIQKNTRVYAKKQLTWYKKDPLIKRIDLENPININVNKIIELFGK